MLTLSLSGNQYLITFHWLKPLAGWISSSGENLISATGSSQFADSWTSVSVKSSMKCKRAQAAECRSECERVHSVCVTYETIE